MSEEELNKIKAELKKEILNELTSKQIVKDNAWKKVKKEFEKIFYSKGYNPKEQYQIFNAISTITRISLGYTKYKLYQQKKQKI